MVKSIFSTKVMVAVMAAIVFSSCQIRINDGIEGNGNVTTQTRDVGGNFSKIEANKGLNVTIEQAGQYSVEVEADENLQEHITTKVENGTLVITTDENIDEATNKDIHIKMPSLTEIETSSAASVSTRGTFKGVGSSITVKTSSGSEANLDLEFDNINCDSSSGSSISVSGKALKLTTDSGSGSTIDAQSLLVNDVVADASSGSSNNVHPLVSLDAKASSGSSINYSGSPTKVTKHESSGGSVSKE